MDEHKEQQPLTVSKLERKIIDAAVAITESQDDINPTYLHSALCQMGLPRSPVKDSRMFERKNGNSSLLVEGGRLYKDRQWVEMPIPYGTKPRLVLIHACAEAVRTQSPVIEVGNSVNEFLRTLNIDTSGRGYQLFRNQMEALAACRMTIGMSTATKDITIETKPIDYFEAWLSNNGEQESMWPGVMRLSPKFYETLTQHAMPLDPRAIAALQTSALALDIYTMLAHRLCRVRDHRGANVSWANMKEQLGHEYKTSKDFKKSFKTALKRVLAVYPDARVRENKRGGLTFYPSPPPIKKTKVVVNFNREN